MKTKTCRDCGNEKSEDQFVSGRNWCLECRKIYLKEYNAHPIRRADRKKRNKVKREELRAWLREIKRKTPCSDCNQIWHPDVMEWDHKPGYIKIDSIQRLIGRCNRSILETEIAKCDLVCANCHRLRTRSRAGWSD